MMKCAFVCILICLGLSPLVQAQELRYEASGIYETNDLGQIISQGPFSGWLVLGNTGTYNLDFQVTDQGQYQYMTAGGQIATDTIFFFSNNGYQFFGYPQGDILAVWLYRTQNDTNIWVALQAANSSWIGTADGSSLPTSQAPQTAFSGVVMYGTTSGPYDYSQYDPDTGYFYENQKGIIFRPDGTFYLKVDFGGTTTEEVGTYQIAGNQVLLAFSDGSTMILTIEEQGRKLNWYSGGMLISEFFYLGES
jgi:hypothetical protein